MNRLVGIDIGNADILSPWKLFSRWREVRDISLENPQIAEMASCVCELLYVPSMINLHGTRCTCGRRHPFYSLWKTLYQHDSIVLVPRLPDNFPLKEASFHFGYGCFGYYGETIHPHYLCNEPRCVSKGPFAFSHSLDCPITFFSVSEYPVSIEVFKGSREEIASIKVGGLDLYN